MNRRTATIERLLQFFLEGEFLQKICLVSIAKRVFLLNFNATKIYLQTYQFIKENISQ